MRTRILCGQETVSESSTRQYITAMAGYPHITVPAGFVHDLPVGWSFFAGAYQEGNLLRYAYAFEQATQARHAPRFVATVKS